MKSTILAIMAVALFTGSASAQDSGSFRTVRAYVKDYTSIEYPGETFTAGSLLGTSTVTSSSGEPFTQGSVSVIRCAVYARRSGDASVSLDSPCLLTDRDGDEVYARSKRDVGDIQVGGGGAGRTELIGGTGKYEGITGSCVYDTNYLPGDHIVSLVDCTWKR